jgi:hypothetical protein
MNIVPVGKHLFFYKGKIYPNYITRGNACSFIIPAAQLYCKGEGLDIGGYPAAVFPGATPINILLDDQFDAFNLPPKKYDYIFSSHTLEHLNDHIGLMTEKPPIRFTVLKRMNS